MKVTIQSRWDLFNAMVLPHDLPVSERNILKMAFYAGVLTRKPERPRPSGRGGIGRHAQRAMQLLFAR